MIWNQVDNINARIFNAAPIGLYTSSKADVTIISETLRLELAPLGVTVIMGVLGHIEFSFHVNDSRQWLPESSRYKSVEAEIAKSAEGKGSPKAESAEDFTRPSVGDVLGGASGQVCRGAKAQTIRVVGQLAPVRILVCDDFVLSVLLGWRSTCWLEY